MRFFDKYTGFWRRWKLLYAVYNLWNAKQLKGNKKAYEKYGLKKPVWMPLNSSDFEHLEAQELSQGGDTFWQEKGFYKIDSLFSEEYVVEINRLVQEALDQGKVDFNYSGKKILFAYEEIPRLKEIIHNEAILEKLSELMGGEVVPFQSINFVYGSEQKAHSDSIHMSTFPKGGLIAIWIALDDVDEKNGPLFYYPGSHKWPYVSNEDMGASTGWMLSPNPNKLYEEYLEKKIKEEDAEPSYYYPKKGDALIWHANLVHGGMPHQDKNKTRRSMVIHYFRKDVICYHEISQRPAIVNEI
ncbi:phytanoyl-CoA dioxygenase family protein [bacterium]|nr:phytanoyl-CoA dioxygenase family protein [bacterium]